MAKSQVQTTKKLKNFAKSSRRRSKTKIGISVKYGTAMKQDSFGKNRPTQIAFQSPSVTQPITASRLTKKLPCLAVMQWAKSSTHFLLINTKNPAASKTKTLKALEFFGAETKKPGLQKPSFLIGLTSIFCQKLKPIMKKKALIIGFFCSLTMPQATRKILERT